MKKVFINSVGSISSQKTFDNDAFLDELTSYTETVIGTIDPVYKDFIPPAAARRMAKGIKMGVVASKIALDDAGLDIVDAVITGTGMGCVKDSEKFVSAIIDNNEEFLTPTSFIQSTHNTVAGQIALGLGCKGYNFTYVHSSVSFESALLDAKMQLENDEATNILVGGVDELGNHTVAIHRLINHIKPDNQIDNLKLLESTTPGSIFGEGANFFVVSNMENENSYAQVMDIAMYNTLSVASLDEVIQDFLNNNNMSISAIDAIVLGNNGDAHFDSYYNALTAGSFSETQQLYYKHLSGEFKTASSFGVWVAAKVLRGQQVPDVIKMNNVQTSEINNIVVYNQYRGENHSLTLLRKC